MPFLTDKLGFRDHAIANLVRLRNPTSWPCDVVTEHGADASMRDIARRAGVGLATLLRHFPTRKALFEALLRTNLDALTQKAGELEASNPPDDALVSWFREGVAFVGSYNGVVALMDC